MIEPISFEPTCDLSMLRHRAQLMRTLRDFFDKRGFVEVQTPVLGAETVIDAHIDPIEVNLQSIGITRGQDQAESWYLQTSPELMMKRLLAAGMQAIYQIGPYFERVKQEAVIILSSRWLNGIVAAMT